MTRYVMVIDLRRCVGCQTCTAACKTAHATPPGVQWRRVLDLETGEFPEVRRSFVPVSCMHCEHPPCEEVCPTTATKKREDGLVTIDYDTCIGCANCVMACPYEARSIVHEPRYAYGEQPIPPERIRFDPARIGVATKCTFCKDRIDAAARTGQKPGRDPEVTPACVNSCISGAMVFGDRDDPASDVNRLLSQTEHFRMHEELGTNPGVYYIWDQRRPHETGNPAR
jgi:phenylacetyl-CoA:acceptor oxidoreductase 27-kDa subunit